MKTTGTGDHIVPLPEMLPTLAAFPQLRALALDGFEVKGEVGQLRDMLPHLVELRLRGCEILGGANTEEGLASLVEKLTVRNRACYQSKTSPRLASRWRMQISESASVAQPLREFDDLRGN